MAQNNEPAYSPVLSGEKPIGENASSPTSRVDDGVSRLALTSGLASARVKTGAASARQDEVALDRRRRLDPIERTALSARNRIGQLGTERHLRFTLLR